ncbi:hypothetical protein XU18_5002 [Perkinsela sp. CCAP 1560/4]|nr:hypothetical protein XU18_5002 [Perkinsela sp. CCAP 1560/4]|eukprot:KNH03662.1 hypothetical protein XU18_5002 [Perkinsela sp. CCAP 1560/4]
MSGKPRKSGKSMFAAKRAKIFPIPSNPTVGANLIRMIHSTDPLKQKAQHKYIATGQEAARQSNVPPRLDNRFSKRTIEKASDPEFVAFAEFLEGRRFGDILSARKYQHFYDLCSNQDDVIVWLCMSAMSVLNPGDLRSRVLYQHLKALLKAVANREMHPRTAFYFYENVVRGPAFRELAQTQLNHGQPSRLLGICAGAHLLKETNLCSRPMQGYFELYKRISERSEFFTPWGFPPLYQFEERLQLLNRLRPFNRAARQKSEQKKKTKLVSAKFKKYYGGTIMWLPPLWRQARTWMGPFYRFFKSVVPD